MTRLLFIPDENTFLSFDFPLPAGELLRWVKNGHWRPPPPYERDFGYGTGGLASLHVIQAGPVVVVTTRPPARCGHGRVRSRRANLSRRQLEVLKAMSEGLTVKQIAARLELNPRTVDFHLARIKICLGARSRLEMVSRATTLGLLHEDKK